MINCDYLIDYLNDPEDKPEEKLLKYASKIKCYTDKKIPKKIHETYSDVILSLVDTKRMLI